VPVAIIQVFSFVVAVVFAWSAVAKLARPHNWRALLARYRLGPLGVVAAALVPALEATVVVSVLVGATRVAGALSVGMLSAFTLAVVRLRNIEGDRLPCGCFGSTKHRDYRVVLLRNTALGVAAGVMLVGGRDRALFEGLAMPEGVQVVPAILVLTGAGVGVWLLYTITRSFKRGV